MRKQTLLKTLPLALLTGCMLLSGCSSVVNSHLQKEPMMTAYESGDNSAALQEINNKLSEPAWYNSSVINTGDELIWRLEAGSLNFHLGNFAEAVEQFKIAEELIASYDERARISLRDAGAEVGSALTNLNALPYRGWCRDRMALSIYKSLAYLGMGNEDAFRAQLKRLRNEQKKVQDDYREFFEQDKKEIASAGAQNPEVAKEAADNSSTEKMTEHPQNEDFAASVKEMRAIANKGYGNFLNPAATFLSGLGALRDGNYDNARIEFKRLYEAMPKNPMTQRYYVTSLRLNNRTVPSSLKNVKSFDFPLNRNCVYVIAANGRSAAFKQIAAYFPIMTAWPVCEFYPAIFDKISVKADNRDYPTCILADMDGILAQEFNERLPLMITRIVLSTALKEAAKYAATYAAARENLLIGAGVYIGASIYTAAMNTADTRSWEILPKEFYLTQLPMPKDRKLELKFEGYRTAGMTVDIPEDCRSAIVFVNSPSENNIKYHVLAIKNK